MCDLICDVMSFCVWTFDMGKINAYDEIVIKTRKKRKYGNQRNVYINLHLIDGLGI